MFTKRVVPGILLGLIAAFAQACAAENAEVGAAEPGPEAAEATGAAGATEVTGTVAQDLITESRDPNALTDIPSYFAVPKHALGGTLEVERKGYPWSTVWSPSRGNPNLGLRMIAIPETGRDARLQMARELGENGVMQDGDIVLSFRTALADTMAYPHIQMGSTHAGLVFQDADKGPAHNLDQPLDGDYNTISNKRFIGSFDSKHYVGQPDSTDALHILRPKWTPEQRAVRSKNLREWVKVLGETHERIRGAGGLNFNSDYLKPLINASASAAKIATEFGHIMVGRVQPRQDFDMFCSEMAYHLLTLSNCTVDELKSPNVPVGGEAPCTQSGAPFNPMRLLGDGANAPGLAEGPLLGLMHSGIAPAANALDAIFPSGPTAGAAKLSAGHRAVAEATKPLMGGIQMYYGLRLQAATATDESARAALTAKANEAAAGVNAMTGNGTNYSPTAFLVESMRPDANARGIDYIATVVFTNGGATARAKGLSKPGPVPAPAP